MPYDPDDLVWKWVQAGRSEPSGRVHYKRVAVHRRGAPDSKRHFSVGEAVVVSAEEGEVWIGHLIDMFQAPRNDAVFQNDEGVVVTKPTTNLELMRVSIRWFYQQKDMNMNTLKHSRTKSPQKDEIWFSDHVEQGINDVQVIEGKAWLFQTKSEMERFKRDPHPQFHPAADKVRLVRAFVNSQDGDQLPVRELERDELKYLLDRPSSDENLYVKSRTNMFGEVTAAVKGTGYNKKKNRRPRATTRERPDVEEEEFQPDPEAKLRKDRAQENQKRQVRLENQNLKRRSQNHVRRKVVDDDDDDDDSEVVLAQTPIPSRKRGDAQAAHSQQNNEISVVDFIQEMNDAVDEQFGKASSATMTQLPRSASRQTKTRTMQRQRSASTTAADTRQNLAKNRRRSDPSANSIVISDDDDDFVEVQGPPRKSTTIDLRKKGTVPKQRSSFMPAPPRKSPNSAREGAVLKRSPVTPSRRLAEVPTRPTGTASRETARDVVPMDIDEIIPKAQTSQGSASSGKRALSSKMDIDSSDVRNPAPEKRARPFQKAGPSRVDALGELDDEPVPSVKPQAQRNATDEIVPLQDDENIQRYLHKIRVLHDGMSKSDQALLMRCFDMCLNLAVDKMCDGDTVKLDSKREKDVIQEVTEAVMQMPL